MHFQSRCVSSWLVYPKDGSTESLKDEPFYWYLLWYCHASSYTRRSKIKVSIILCLCLTAWRTKPSFKWTAMVNYIEKRFFAGLIRISMGERVQLLKHDLLRTACHLRFLLLFPSLLNFTDCAEKSSIICLMGTFHNAKIPQHNPTAWKKGYFKTQPYKRRKTRYILEKSIASSANATWSNTFSDVRPIGLLDHCCDWMQVYYRTYQPKQCGKLCHNGLISGHFSSGR